MFEAPHESFDFKHYTSGWVTEIGNYRYVRQTWKAQTAIPDRRRPLKLVFAHTKMCLFYPALYPMTT